MTPRISRESESRNTRVMFSLELYPDSLHKCQIKKNIKVSFRELLKISKSEIQRQIIDSMLNQNNKSGSSTSDFSEQMKLTQYIIKIEEEDKTQFI